MSRPLHPDFAIEALQLLDASRAIDAVRLCSMGIEDYPQYAGGYVMLAKAYAKLGLTDDAEALVRDITMRFPHVHVTLSQRETVEAPVVEAPQAEAPEVESPEVESPEAEAPEVETLEVEALEVETPEVEIPEFETPDVVTPELVAQPSEQVDEVSVAPYHVLRMIETAPIADDAPIIRSGSVRLIPGLEFTTLRVEGIRSRGRRGIGSLPEPPSFRAFHAVRRPQRPAEPTPQRKPISLEELASRLVDVKMPRQSEIDAASARNEPPPPPQPQPILVTETIANIYMQQQSYDLAIEAYKTLMTRKPERRDHFEALIRECERKRG
ncbi:MAG: hypothetical protein FGM33_01445 [Candidatus Kapabacteria bacterium]|nr:hypothetical protein [Candidatus Kapabacteria bacterium]